MKKIFIVNGIEYIVETCTAIAASIGDTERQNAIYVESKTEFGEIIQYVVFGFEMPETEEDFKNICESGISWDSYIDTIITVERGN